MKKGIDLVKGQPVLHLILISGENGAAVPFEKSDQLPASPAVVLFRQPQRSLIMGYGNQRFYPVF